MPAFPAGNGYLRQKKAPFSPVENANIVPAVADFVEVAAVECRGVRLKYNFFGQKDLASPGVDV